MKTIQCPSCEMRLPHETDFDGKLIECPGCGTPLIQLRSGHEQEEEALLPAWFVWSLLAVAHVFAWLFLAIISSAIEAFFVVCGLAVIEIVAWSFLQTASRGRRRLREYRNRTNRNVALPVANEIEVHDTRPSVAAKPANQFHTKVAGVTYDNSDGSSRQAIISKRKVGERLILRDGSAEFGGYEVCTPWGKQLGFINAGLAAEFEELFDDGCRIEITICDLTGGDAQAGKPSLGVNLLVTVYG